MRVFVAGGTGTLGRPTTRLLVAAGHEVCALARTPERGEALRRLGAEPVVADLFDARAMTAAVEGSEAILHLATRIPPLAQMRKLAAWRDNDRLRSQGASVLVNAALAAKARIYLQESITFLYRDLGDTQLFETAPIDAPQPLASARDAERETARFSARGGQGVVLRFGAFYSAEAPSTLATIRLARRRLFPIIGTGDHYVSSIHVDDAAAATVAALQAPAGIYNVVDDEPLPMREHVAALTEAFQLRPARHLPLWIARLALGSGIDVLTRSQRVNNTMFKAVSGWSPRYRAFARAGARSPRPSAHQNQLDLSRRERLRSHANCRGSQSSISSAKEEAHPMRPRVLLCAIAAVAVATTTLTPPTPAQAGTYPGNKCVADKLKAASRNCRGVLYAWSNFIGEGGTDTVTRDAALGALANKMSGAWFSAEYKADKKEVDCADMTLTDGAAQAAITGAVTGIVNDVLVGLTLSNPADAKCGAALIKAAAGQCAALLKSESSYIAKLAAGKNKRDTANAKAYRKLSSKVVRALSSGCPSGAGIGSLDFAVKAVTGDLITNTTISPNLDDTQFTTISPAQNPGQAYEGSQLHPICAFGTDYHYFVKRGSVNKLVMYYQGGGACWNYNTCGLLTTFDKDVNPAGSDNPNNTHTGFGDLTNPLNPFKDWNIVFVSYCTGDIHFGDSNPSYSGTNTRHKGWHNARTAEKFAREHFVNPEEVFVTGSSAGAYGAFFNAPLHHAVWPDSKFTVLGDAGNGVITTQFLTDNFPTWNFAAHLPTNIPGVEDAITNAGGIPAYTEAMANYFPNTAWGHYTSSYDGGTGGQTGFYNVMLNPTNVLTWANWWNASCAWNTNMRAQAIATAANVPSNYRYYIGTGSRHTMYGSNKVYTDTTGGVPLIVDWVNSMLARDAGWTNVECTSGCGTLLPGDPQPGSLPTPPFSQSGPDVVITCP